MLKKKRKGEKKKAERQKEKMPGYRPQFGSKVELLFCPPCCSVSTIDENRLDFFFSPPLLPGMGCRKTLWPYYIFPVTDG